MEQLRDVVAPARKQGTVVVSDECYIELDGMRNPYRSCTRCVRR